MSKQEDFQSILDSFIGLNNYVKLFTNYLFHTAIKNTFILTFFSIVITLAIALVLALVLNRRKIRHQLIYNIYEAIFFLPFIISWVPVAVIWKWIYDPTYGIMNAFVGIFGIRPQEWLVNPDMALFSIIILIVWKNVGFNTVVFSTGLKNIPEEYYDAATVDGAVGSQIFRYITLPLIKPIILFLFVSSTILNFAIFTPVYIMTLGSQGAPGNAVRVLVYDIYQNGFLYRNMGLAAAESSILLVIIVILTLIEFKVIRRDV